MDREALLASLRDPRLLVHRLHYEVVRKILGKKGNRIMEQDWDNLLILDACRYDLFESIADLPGQLEKRVSKGSHTVEFLHNNFDRGTFYDTVYVSATPQVTWEGFEDRFHATVRVWGDRWDDDLGTVPPEAVHEAAVEAAEEYPHKRLIIHFVQPHFPFIGEAGGEIGADIDIRSGIGGETNESPTIWDLLQSGQIPRERLWKAYRENLELTLPSVRDLLDELNGKSVVTSDHGNAFGEWGLYGHPGKKGLAVLIEIPWLSVEAETRRSIRAETRKSVTAADIDESTINERLSSLGYK